jgi:hypothetical protein
MHQMASHHAQADGTKVNLVQYATSVAAVNVVIDRIKTAGKID